MLTLSNVKQHLRIDFDEDDFYLHGLIDVATKTIEAETNRAIETITLTHILDGFDSTITLPEAPIQSVTSIRYHDQNRIEQTLPSTEYTVDSRKVFTEITPAYGKTWPTTTPAPQSVTVTYIAGYQPSNIPAPLKQAALMLIGSLYEQRENHVEGEALRYAPVGVKHLIRRYKVPVVV